MELFDLFKNPLNIKHRFLQTTPQMNQIGYNKLAMCYKNGKIRMNKLYKQEVTYEEPRNTSGRTCRNISIEENREILHKRTCSRATNEEVNKLQPLIEQNEKPTSEQLEMNAQNTKCN
ncbi:524_t:CDS:2 [Funneliformis geosporum]|uniref:5622_t:CDS:1 n=1 Tax=Funneliformis geosporum TaxID=1117311 RepID=A0A9W4SV24_9GLOM|nr:5622_t:CDS:2 [Funneliformis geosporum]CAI2189356.1 524_t:CDS:2 [Funneliformis geosporum]